MDIVILPGYRLLKKRLLDRDPVDGNFVILFVELEVLVTIAAVAIDVDGDWDAVGATLAVHGPAVEQQMLHRQVIHLVRTSQIGIGLGFLQRKSGGEPRHEDVAEWPRLDRRLEDDLVAKDDRLELPKGPDAF